MCRLLEQVELARRKSGIRWSDQQLLDLTTLTLNNVSFNVRIGLGNLVVNSLLRREYEVRCCGMRVGMLRTTWLVS